MRFLFLFLILLPFIIACILEPHVEINNSGACYSGLQEYENLIKTDPPVIKIIDGLQDTIFLNSIITHHQIQFSASIDIGYFKNGTYEVSIIPDVFKLEDSLDFTGHLKPARLKVTMSPPHKMTGTANVFTATLAFVTDSSYLNDYGIYGFLKPDTGLCKLNFRLQRSVNNNFCSSAYISSVKTIFVRRFYK